MISRHIATSAAAYCLRSRSNAQHRHSTTEPSRLWRARTHFVSHTDAPVSFQRCDDDLQTRLRQAAFSRKETDFPTEAGTAAAAVLFQTVKTCRPTTPTLAQSSHS